MNGMVIQGQDGGWRNWLAVAMLGLGAFVVVTTELAPIGMLSAMANDLAQSPSRTGLVVTAYAWIGALAALLAVLTVSGWPRRPLLVGMMLLLALSNGLAAASGSFYTLLAARLMGALAHGAFWAMAATLGGQLVPPQRVGRATAIIFGGVSAASVLGVPLINVISNHANWRMAFACLGLLALLVGLALAVLLPRMTGGTTLRPTQLLSVFGHAGLRWLYLISACAIVAHFAAYTYVEVLLSSRLQVSAEWVAMCLFVFGAAGIAGNVLCGALIDHHLKSMLAAALLAIALCLLVIGLGIAHSVAAATVLMLAWGVAVAVLYVSIQTGVIILAGDAALPASAISAAIFNGALGVGALVGSGALANWGAGALCLGAAVVMAGCTGLVSRLGRGESRI